MPHSQIGEHTLVGGTPDFRTTHWSVVLLAGKDDSTQATAALEKLCRTYWYPIYSFIRRRGYDSIPHQRDQRRGDAKGHRHAFAGTVREFDEGIPGATRLPFWMQSCWSGSCPQAPLNDRQGLFG